MLVRATVDAESYFLLPISQICWNKSFSRKAVLPRHAESTWLNSSFSLLGFSFSLLVGAASALLASAWVPSSSRRGLGRRSVWASFWCGACACTPGYCSRSVQARGLNSAATHASGVLGGINCQQWLVRSIVLACPCWSLEGLLFVTQKPCLRKSYRFASNKHLIVLVPYIRLRSCHGTTRLIRGTQISVTLSTLNQQKRPKKERFLGNVVSNGDFLSAELPIVTQNECRVVPVCLNSKWPKPTRGLALEAILLEVSWCGETCK